MHIHKISPIAFSTTLLAAALAGYTLKAIHVVVGSSARLPNQPHNSTLPVNVATGLLRGGQ